jgi:ABC-type transporter Mla MlaB component
MSCNFKILTHQNSENVHLKLMGDFDGSSACELLNVLKTYSNKANRVFIHTDGLKEVDLFGKLVFQNDFTAIAQQPAGFVFTGEKLAP